MVEEQRAQLFNAQETIQQERSEFNSEKSALNPFASVQAALEQQILFEQDKVQALEDRLLAEQDKFERQQKSIQMVLHHLHLQLMCQ